MITVHHIIKSPRTTSTAYALISTDTAHTYGEIVDAGLSALNESRHSLYGFGIESPSEAMRIRDDSTVLNPGNYRVYAYRD